MRAPSMVPALFRAAGAALTLTVPLGAQGRPDPPRLPSELRPYQELADRAEGWYATMERDANAFFAWADSKESVAEADAAVARHLDGQPNDAAALVLRARLLQLTGLYEDVLTVQAGELVRTGQGDIPDRVRALLRRAVELAPTGWPEPHYRLGRVYLLPRVVTGPGGPELRIDADSALMAARRALEMDPRNREYRTLLGEASLAAGDTASALELLPGLAEQFRLLGEIRGDLGRVPVPSGAAEGGHFLATYASMLSQSSFGAYPADRVRSWLVPLGADQIEAFYQERAAGFRLLTEDMAPPDAGADAPKVFMQHLRLDGDRLVAARDERALEREMNRMSGGDSRGVLILVGTHIGVPEGLEAVDLPSGFEDGGPLAEIVLLSLRRDPR